jgi:hypothetical protein
MASVLERGDKLEDLVAKSDQLSATVRRLLRSLRLACPDLTSALARYMPVVKDVLQASPKDEQLLHNVLSGRLRGRDDRYGLRCFFLCLLFVDPVTSEDQQHQHQHQLPITSNPLAEFASQREYQLPLN